MDKEKQKKAILSFLLETDIRFFYHTLSETDTGYFHIDEKCPRCITIKYLSLSTDI